jgi:uncharacterized protein HemX
MTTPVDTPPRTAEHNVAYTTSADELAWRELIHDQLRSLRTGMVLLGVLAVAALGIALWGLLTAQSERNDRQAVSVARARSIERRIDRLEARVERLPSAAEVARIEGRLQELQAAASRAQQASAALEVRVRELGQRVDELPAATPMPTPTP